MAVILNASTTTGFVQTADTSGQIQLQSNGTTELTVTSTGVTVADNLLFNSGYGSAAVGYGCRGWVNFNGTGTVALRASGNVSSITDNGTGNYTINFTNAMPDADYATIGTASDTGNRNTFNRGSSFVAQATTSVRVTTGTPAGGLADVAEVHTSIFR